MLSFTCLYCIHYEFDNKCKAFKINIPLEIVEGKNDHTEPLPDQENDIVFEPIEDVKTT